MAFLSQFLTAAQVAKLSDAQVEQLAEQVHFVQDRAAIDNPQVHAQVEKALKPAAESLLK